MQKLSQWELSTKIDDIIEDNIKDVPYEGREIDKYGMKNSILDLIYKLCPEYTPD